MNKHILVFLAQKIKEHRLGKIRCAMSVLLIITVSFGTVFSLMRPAIALVADDVDVGEMHVHTKECYDWDAPPEDWVNYLSCNADWLEVHEHTSDCFETDEDGNRTLTCGIADYVVHRHEADCYEDGNIICGLAECLPPENIETFQHTHTLECYLPDSFHYVTASASNATSTEEDQSENAVTVASSNNATKISDKQKLTGTLICGLEAFAENEIDSDEEDAEEYMPDEMPLEDDVHRQIMKIRSAPKEGIVHEHDSSCYDEEGNRICGLLETEEHIHSSDCYINRPPLICGEAGVHPREFEEEAEEEIEVASEEETEVEIEAETEATEEIEPEEETAEPQAILTDEIASTTEETAETPTNVRKAVKKQSAKENSQNAAELKTITIESRNAQGTSTQWSELLELDESETYDDVVTVNADDSLRLTLKYNYPIPQKSTTEESTAEESASGETYQFTDQLPATLKIANAKYGDVLDADDNIIGQYKISTDGTITITLDADDVDASRTADEASETDIECYLRFVSGVSDIDPDAEPDDTTGILSKTLAFENFSEIELQIDSVESVTGEEYTLTKSAITRENNPELGENEIQYSIQITTSFSGSMSMDDGSASSGEILESETTFSESESANRYLTLEDTASYLYAAETPCRVSLKEGSLNVYDEMGNELSEDSYRYVFDTGDIPESDGTVKPELNMILPEGEPLEIVYTYQVNGSSETPVTIENTAVLKSGGTEIASTEEPISKERIPVESTGDVTLYKVNADDYSEKLSGVRFHLYQWDTENQSWIPVEYVDSEKLWISLEDDGSADWVTDSDGKILFENLTTNRIYKLEELETAAGYQIGGPYYFYLLGETSDGDTSSILPDDFEGEIVQPGQTIYIQNLVENSSTQIYLRKLDLSYKTEHAGEDTKADNLPGAEFQLYRYRDEDHGFIEQEQYTTQEGQDLKIEDLQYDTVYKLVETNPPTGYHLDDPYEPYYFYVTTWGTVLPEIKDNDKSVTLHKLKADELVRIYNTQATQVITGYTLPETGGGGNLPYTTGGLIMILASAGTILYGKHRRKEDESSF